MQLLEVRAGLNAELVVKAAPDLAVGSQGVGLSIKSVQRHHSLFVKLFLKRMLCKQASGRSQEERQRACPEPVPLQS